MFRKISNITVAFILLVSFTGFTVDLHYCKDKLYDVGILSEAMDCCESEAGQAHSDHCDMSNTHSCCEAENHDPRNCERKTVKIESPSDFYITSPGNNFKLEPVSLVLADHYLLVSKDNSEEDYRKINSDYFSDISPPETGEVLSRLQSYLN